MTSSCWAGCRTWRPPRSVRSSRPPTPPLLGFDNWTELAKPRDLEKIFDSIEYVKWTSFRDTEDSRFVILVIAARAVPTALRSRHQADRGVRLRGGRAGPARAGPHTQTLHLDERGLRAGHQDDRRFRPVRLVHGDPRRRGGRQGRGTAGISSSSATTATRTSSARPRSASPIAARPS